MSSTLDYIATKAPGEDFDIDGVTYRIVYLVPSSVRSARVQQVCGLCPANLNDCRCQRGCRNDPSWARPGTPRAVVPVSEIPYLLLKGDLA